MAFFRGSGGSIFEMDPPRPTDQNGLELRAYKIAKGELVEVPAERVTTVTEQIGVERDGKPIMATKFVEVSPPEPAAKKKGAADPADPPPAL